MERNPRLILFFLSILGYSSILQRWKRALHVPLRLDVYYQHADSRRELLERWCLEYVPKTEAHHPTASFQNPSADPIVQLRAVCKQIVIWLRSLYCWSRMLPAQVLKNQNLQNNAIGFSIYVVSEGNDDVSGLVSQQGFTSQFQPHSVWTPYGELGWRVFFAPSGVVQRFIPERAPYSSPVMIRPSQPIPMRPTQPSSRPTQQQPPMNQQQQLQQMQMMQAQSYYPNRDLNRRESTPLPTTIVRSAPHQTGRMYQRSKSDVSGVHDVAQDLETISRAVPEDHNNHHPANGMTLHRQNSSPVSPNGGKSLPSKKNLSGLSLAMMTLSDDDLAGNTYTTDSPTTVAANAEAAEKRRAALHHAPPQLPQSSTFVPRKSPLAAAGEYGYAYNNQIPTMRSSQPQTINGYGQTPPTMAINSSNPLLSYSSMPSSTPLGSTPPGYLLGGPTPSPHLSASHLIPPRNNAVTPPFTRPMGFVGEAPTQQSLPPAAMKSGYTDGRPHSSTVQPELPVENSSDKLAAPLPIPMTSLDLLHSSPFRLQMFGSNFGSSTIGALDPFFSGSVAGGLSLDTAFANSSFGSGMHPRLQPMEDEDDNMPFAVDSMLMGNAHHDPSSSSTMAASAAGSSTMIMRDMITQPPKRLQLFDSSNNGIMSDTMELGGNTGGIDGIMDMNDDIASQLAEFKSFGESLLMLAGSQTTTSN